MKMIIVGVDGSASATEAAHAAARLAAATGAALHVVCAYARDQVADIDAGDSQHRVSVAEESESIAAAEAARVAIEGTATTSRAVQGKPAEALASEAERLDADVIVVGNKRVQSVSRVLGSVAAAVAHRAPCDVYIAHTT